MSRNKRKAILKSVREDVYKKYKGHCAYCGNKIEYKNFQVDHLIPHQRERFGKYSEAQIESFENYMPACRRCNHYKRAHSLEVFRKYIEEIPRKLNEQSYIYKIGKNYGFIRVDENPKVEFYFEYISRTNLGVLVNNDPEIISGEIREVPTRNVDIDDESDFF